MLRRAAAAVAAAGVLLALGGCGGSDSVGLTPATGDTAHGKELFQQKCGGCHGLADAGARGQQGPNLDEAFAFTRVKGEEWQESTIREVVRDQISYAEPPMPDLDEMFPKCKSEGEPKGCSEDPKSDADDVAAYVASVVAKVPVPGVQESGAPGAEPVQLFTQNCGGCHALEAAGTTAAIGPNLDQTSMDVGEVAKQIANGGGAMPPFKGQLTDAEIQALAKYVVESKKSQ